jgi:aryl carrier-like protein
MQLPEAATSDEAAGFARNFLGLGLDSIKLFTGSYLGKACRQHGCRHR